MIDPQLEAAQALERRALRERFTNEDSLVMARFKRLMDEVAFELDPLLVNVILDRLRGQRNSGGLDEAVYAKAERLLALLGVDELVERMAPSHPA